MRKMFATALVLFALVMLPGCGLGVEMTPVGEPPPAIRVTPKAPPAAEQIVQSARPRAVAPADNPDLPELAAGNTAFAFDLYRQLAKGDGNLFYSPHSISLALAMTYAGARGQTEQQMASTMHYTLGQDRLHAAFNSLDHALASRGQGAQGADSKGFRLKVANAIWGQTGFSFQQPFLDVLASNYGAGLRLLDFGSPEPARGVINKWVSDQTEGKIRDLLAPGTITPDSRLVLTNAIYFNAAWSEQFDKNSTQDGKFRLIDGEKTIEVPMMIHAASYGYTAGEGYQAVELPYDGNELSMVVLVPDLGQFPRVESSVSASLAGDLVKNLKERRIILSMPRWKFDSTFSLGDVLGRMGMGDALVSGKADFSGMDGKRDLFISDVLHKAFVSVDEAGTEAAAATAVVVAAGIAPTEPLKLTVDRPFIFFIYDRPTATILFVGRVMNPS